MIVLCIISNISFAQSDTVIVYFNDEGISTSKDSAVTYMKFFKQSNIWHGVEYYAKTQIVKSEGNFADDRKTPVGKFKNYTAKGELDYEANYQKDAVEKTWFYKNGAKKSWILYTSNKIDQKGWDESGKEIRNYVVEREAKFKGGLEGWRKFLEKNLNGAVAADAGAPTGSYTIKVRFVVNKDGYVSNIQPVSVPTECKPCFGEVKRLLVAAPQWEHAIQNNVPVIYQAIQNVTFQVTEEKKKRKG